MNQTLGMEQFNTERTEIQILVRKLIERDIYCNQSALIEELLSAGACGVFDYDHLQNEPMDIDSEECHPEILQWYAVSEWLADQLDRVNAPILSNEYGTWWGRQERYQNLEFDARLNDVARAILKVEDEE